MKCKFTSLLAIVAATLTFSCSSPASTDQWQLVWEDNFDGNAIDTSVWSKIPRGGSDWDNYMSFFDSCYVVSNGNLTLRGILNTSQSQDTARFLTGGIWTKDKKVFEQGKVEIRAKLESAQGAWPAFWMLGANGKYPANGEIDIMEHLNFDTIVYQTVHSEYTLKHGIKDNPRSGTIGTINPAEYNTYGVELSADSVVFSVNGKNTLSYPKIATDKSGQYPFGNPMYLLIDMQLGGSWVGAVDPSQLPVEMQIDWVRFYQKDVTAK